MLQSGGQNHRWPISGPCGYMTRATCGVPNALEREKEAEVGQKWAGWLNNPWCQTCKSRGQNQRVTTSRPVG